MPLMSEVKKTGKRGEKVGTFLSWTLAVLACLWVAWCCAIGPLYWFGGGLSDFGWLNVLYLVVAFAICFSIVVALVRFGHGRRVLPRYFVRRYERLCDEIAGTPSTVLGIMLRHLHDAAHSRPGRALHAMIVWLGRKLTRCTDCWWKLMLVFVIGWLWVPTTLLAAFGADIRSQIREFSWALNQWMGLKQPYIGFFSFVPMDIYPTAHYMWPDNPTYLTDQHNVVLTVLYGAVAAVSRYFTDSNDAGIVVLAALQWLFAAFCCSATANRFFNLPWRRLGVGTFDFSHPERHDCWNMRDYAPLFAFAFVWWFGVWYELHMTHIKALPTINSKPTRLRKRSIMAFTISSCVMLISAKYAWYIILFTLILALINDRKRWKTYLVALLLPTILIHGGIVFLTNTGAIIGGDPIESRGIQLQQIARVAKYNPNGIPADATEKLEPVFNLDQMAEAYSWQDADPVKSSGIQSKKVSYKWRTVTEDDMKNFNEAWLEIVVANPVIALDAFFAECFGYFDVTDLPYVSMDYYVLMGVMITAPANNFERHMLPVAFVFGFVCLQFWRESRNARLAANANVVSEYEASQVRQDE